MPHTWPTYSKVEAAAAHELDDLHHDNASHTGHSQPIDQPAKHPESPLSLLQVLAWWKWELFMAVVSAISLIALTAVLASFDGQLERRWGPISLNTITVILSTITSSAVLAFVGPALSQHMWNAFAQARKGGEAVARPAGYLSTMDAASRGPWGSFKLLIGLRVINLAALGAVVTLLSLAFGPFTQQLVSRTLLDSSYTDFSQPFPRSRTYQGKDGFFVSRVDFSTRSAIIAAGLQGNNALPFQLNCQTGNCTYPPDIPTLAMCGECTDVTHHLDHKGPCDWDIPNCPGNGRQCHVKGNICPYSLPNGAQLRFQPAVGPGKGVWAVWNATNINWGDVKALVYNDPWHNYAMKFSTIGLTKSKAVSFLRSVYSDPQAGGTLPPVQAQECALWFCLNTYDVSVAANRPKIRLTSSFPKMATSTGTPGLTFYDVSTNTGILDPSAYWVTGEEPLQDALASLIPSGDSYVSGPIQEGQLNYGSQSDFNLTNYHPDNDIQLVEGIYQHSDNLHNWTSNLAQMMTNQFAILAPAQDEFQDSYAGVKNMTQRSHFRIRWYWIILPVAVLLFAYVFLVATMFETQSKIVLPWKGDPLVLALAETDRSVREAFFDADALYVPKSLDKEGSITKVGLRFRSPRELAFVAQVYKEAKVASDSL